MLELEFTLYATPYENRSYAQMWGRQLTALTKKNRQLENASVAERQIIDELRAFSVRPVPHMLSTRPLTRAACESVQRPCPFVSCKWNTYLDVEEDGSVIINWGGCAPDEVPADRSCVLDIADAGGISDEEAMTVLGLPLRDANAVFESGLRRLRHYDVADVLGVFRLST